MEQLNFKHFRRTLYTLSVLFFVFQASALDTKRFDAPPPARGQYVAFTKPITLRYGTSTLPVDRRKLIMPPTSQVAVTITEKESNSSVSTQANDFPLINSEESSNDTPNRPAVELFENMPSVAPPVSLPLTDPFQEVGSMGIDSTDELLEVFETSTLTTPRSRMQAIPFVPPYTIAPDNMRITNKATYQRRQR
ncbi:MAG: hypothetical protein P8P49_12600 [Opitutales bacterium]|nr:hypothetical protein [Opitutales bacterium]